MDEKNQKVATLYEDDRNWLHWVDHREGSCYSLGDDASVLGPFVEDAMMILAGEAEFWKVHALEAPAGSMMLVHKRRCAEVYDDGLVVIYLKGLPPTAQEYIGVDELVKDYQTERKTSQGEG